MQLHWDSCKHDGLISSTYDVLRPSELLRERASHVWNECKRAEDADEAATRREDVSDTRLATLAKFTDHLPLDRYLGVFELVPSLVNVVSLCEALPHPKSQGGGKLPLDLQLIASRCSNS